VLSTFLGALSPDGESIVFTTYRELRRRGSARRALESNARAG
jgi:hypothetical protein